MGIPSSLSIRDSKKAKLYEDMKKACASDFKMT